MRRVLAIAFGVVLGLYPAPAAAGSSWGSPWHVYQAHSQAGYRVQASVRFDVSWTATFSDRRSGPYASEPVIVAAGPPCVPGRVGAAGAALEI
jgi:hypothetical protein